MPIQDVTLPIVSAALPGDVRAFLREAQRRIARFQRDAPIPGFVASDSERTYGVLRALATADLPTGNLFCEWGSGFGVATCLAAMLDFDARGIEIEGRLVDAAQELAADFGLPVEFIRGSFVPRDGTAAVEGGEFAWLTTDPSNAYEELGLAPNDFNVVFAYPWPDEEGAIEDLFVGSAADGALLVTYHGGEDLRLRRKVARRKRERAEL